MSVFCTYKVRCYELSIIVDPEDVLLENRVRQIQPVSFK